MAKTLNQERKKMKPLVMIVFGVIVPIIVIITIVSIILNILDIDAVGWAKEKGNNIPIISNFITTEEEMDFQRMEEHYQQTIQAKDEKIEMLELDIENLKAQIDDLERVLLKAENSDASLQLEEEEEAADPIKDTAKAFQNMDEEQAAKILENMSREEAVNLLNQLSAKVRGGILQEMNPQTAAEITRLLLN